MCVCVQGVSAISAVRMRYGITSPHLLFGLTTGAVWSVNKYGVPLRVCVWCVLCVNVFMCAPVCPQVDAGPSSAG